MAILIDPSINTGREGSYLILRLMYHAAETKAEKEASDARAPLTQHVVQVGKKAAKAAKREKRPLITVEYTIHAAGGKYDVVLTTPSNAIVNTSPLDVGSSSKLLMPMFPVVQTNLPFTPAISPPSSPSKKAATTTTGTTTTFASFSSTSTSVHHKHVSLPGWEGLPPIFIRANEAMAQLILVTEGVDKHEGTTLSLSIRRNDSFLVGSTSLLKAEFNASSGTKVGDNAAHHGGHQNSITGLKSQDAPTKHVAVLPLLIFPCNSQRQAMETLMRHTEHIFRPKTANIIVPGNVPALHIAALHGNLHAVTRLLDSGADPNQRESATSSTALHEATLGGHANVVELLLERGAKQTIADVTGSTPLHRCSAQGDIAIARILLKAEGVAQVLLKKDKKGNMPYQVASSKVVRHRIEATMKSHYIFVHITKEKLFR